MIFSYKDTYTFTIIGFPIPEPKKIASKRFKKGGGTLLGTMKRDPKGRAKAWVDNIQFMTKIFMRDNKLQMYKKGIPLLLGCSFWMLQVKSNKTKYHIQTPDYSNLKYLVENALKGILYYDDSQIVGPLAGYKNWTRNPDKCRVEITIAKVHQNDFNLSKE